MNSGQIKATPEDIEKLAEVLKIGQQVGPALPNPGLRVTDSFLSKSLPKLVKVSSLPIAGAQRL